MRRLSWEELPFTDRQKAALEGRAEMTWELFVQCLEVCYQGENAPGIFKLLDRYPAYAAEFEPTPEETEAEWKRLRPLLVAEFGEAWVQKYGRKDM